MSVIVAGAEPRPNLHAPWLAKVGAAAFALAVVGAGLSVLAYAALSTGLVSAPAPRNPFAAGTTGTGAFRTGMSGLIFALQAQFYAALTAAVQAVKANAAGLGPLMTVGFLYGVFHAAGPGHGKGVISGYMIASRSRLSRGLALSFAAALLQAVVAIALVGLFALVLNATAATINAAARNIELVSFAAVAAMGAVLLWSKASEFVGAVTLVRYGESPAAREAGGFLAQSSGANPGGWLTFGGIVLAAGIRPCSGAIILLVFSLSQGLFAAGAAGALAMAVGTSITTGTLASLTVFAKFLVGRVARRGSAAGPLAFSAFELLAAAFVLLLGAMLFAGVWSGQMLNALD